MPRNIFYNREWLSTRILHNSLSKSLGTLPKKEKLQVLHKPRATRHNYKIGMIEALKVFKRVHLGKELVKIAGRWVTVANSVRNAHAK